MTTTPQTPQELLELNNQPETPTIDSVKEMFWELSYEDQDNLIYHLLQFQVKYHKFLLKKSIDGDKNLPNTSRLYQDVTKLEIISDLYQEIQ